MKKMVGHESNAPMCEPWRKKVEEECAIHVSPPLFQLGRTGGRRATRSAAGHIRQRVICLYCFRQLLGRRMLPTCTIICTAAVVAVCISSVLMCNKIGDWSEVSADNTK